MASTLASVTALLVGVAFLLTGHGLQLTFLPIRATIEGFTPVEIGLLGSAYYAGFVAGCIGAPYLILRAGHIRTFAAMVSLAAAAALAHSLWIDVVPWMAFRAVTGACLAGLYLIVESWLNDRATNQTRGVIMSSYIFVNYTMITVGQLLITFYRPEDFALFAVASMVISLAAVPVALTRSAQPAPVTLVKIDPAGLFRAAPVAVVGVSLIGAAVGAFWALGTVYAIGHNLTTDGAAAFMSAGVIGGALAQWPIGRLSDHIDRRQVLFWLATVAAVVSAALAIIPFGGPVLLVLAFLFGATALPGYGIAAAHAYDRVESANYVQAAASVLLANGAGSIVGPLVASAMMMGVGAPALFIFTCLMQVALAVYVTLRLRRRAPMPGEEKTEFDLAATSMVGAVISPEPLDPADPAVGVPPEAAPAGEDAAEEIGTDGAADERHAEMRSP